MSSLRLHPQRAARKPVSSFQQTTTGIAIVLMSCAAAVCVFHMPKIFRCWCWYCASFQFENCGIFENKKLF
jgi:hypothetical protein